MAIAHRASSSANTGATPAASLSINVPAGVQPNDSLIAVIGADGGTSTTITPPTGWTLVNSAAQSTLMRIAVYSHIAADTEPASYTWTFGGSVAGSVVMAAYSGAHPFAPFNATVIQTTVAATTINGTGTNSTYETGLALQCIIARNTTAASTLTAGGSFVTRQDSCNTAGPFIDVCIADLAKGLTLGGLSTNNATCSQTAVGTMISIFMDEARPPFSSLHVDEYAVGSFAAARTVTTMQYQVNYPNTLLLAFVSLPKDAATVSSITGAGLTWTLVTRANANTGTSEIWRTFASAPISSFQATINYSASVVSGNVILAGFVGADLTGAGGSGAIGSTATGTSTTAAPSLNVTTTRANSWVWSIMNEGSAANGTVTPGTGQVLLRNFNDTTNAASSWLQRQTSLTATAGTVVTMNSTAPSTLSCNIAAVEILPAVRRNMSNLGVG